MDPKKTIGSPELITTQEAPSIPGATHVLDFWDGPVDGWETSWAVSPGTKARVRWPGGAWHLYQLERRVSIGCGEGRAYYYVYRHVGLEKD